jgi:hypothetical protein
MWRMGTPDAPQAGLLTALMADHMARPFPEGVVKGMDYGRVDAVMVDADIHSWCQTIARGGTLSPEENDRFRELCHDLELSLEYFPDVGRPYYAALLEMAEVALGARQ